MVNLPQDPSVDVRILKQMLTESLVASYKLFWFAGIFEEINRGNQTIPKDFFHFIRMNKSGK